MQTPLAFLPIDPGRKLRTASAVRIGTNTGASDSDDVIGRIKLFSGGGERKKRTSASAPTFPYLNGEKSF